MKMCPGQSLGGGNELEGGSGNQRRAVSQSGVSWGRTGCNEAGQGAKTRSGRT